MSVNCLFPASPPALFLPPVADIISGVDLVFLEAAEPLEGSQGGKLRPSWMLANLGLGILRTHTRPTTCRRA